MIGHIVLDMDSEYLVLHASGVGVDELVRIGRLLGFDEDKQKPRRPKHLVFSGGE